MNDSTTTKARRTRLAPSRLLAIAVLIGGASACESDPVGTGHDHEEGDVAHFRLEEVGGGTLYTYDGPTNPDTLTLPDDASVVFEIVWLAADGDVIEPDEGEHGWNVETEAGLTFTPSATEPWRGTLTTMDIIVGNELFSALRVELLHAGEVEFETPEITVRIAS